MAEVVIFAFSSSVLEVGPKCSFFTLYNLASTKKYDMAEDGGLEMKSSILLQKKLIVMSSF